MYKNNKTLGIIPARYESSRFPKKVLVDILGKSMIQRVYEQALKAKELDQVVVATDNELVFEAVQNFGGKVLMTKKTHESGTDRCTEVIDNQLFKDFDVIVNIQGDEPFIQPVQIDKAILFIKRNPKFQIGTLAKKIKVKELLWNPNSVKVVFGVSKNALYFSRNPIPFLRGIEKEQWLENGEFHKHIGLYVFRKEALQRIANLPQSSLEKGEKLEQLRWLENGFQIGIEITDIETIGIDTREDLERVLSLGLGEEIA